MNKRRIDILIVGNYQVGKSSYIQDLNPIDNSNPPTIKVDTTIGEVFVRLHKCISNIPVDAAIIIYDATNEYSFICHEKWYKMIKDIYGDISIILVANKCDLDHKSFYTGQINELIKMYGLGVYNISSKESHMTMFPIRSSIRRVFNDWNIDIIDFRG